MKVQGACKTDSSVPDFVGSQVNEWLKELIVKKDEEVVAEEKTE